MNRILCKNKLLGNVIPKQIVQDWTGQIGQKTTTRLSSSNSRNGSSSADDDVTRNAFKAIRKDEVSSNQYPKFDTKQKKKPELKDLLQDLRKITETVISMDDKEQFTATSVVQAIESYQEKVCPHFRMEALYKHADISVYETHSLKLSVDESSEQTSADLTEDEVVQDQVLKNDEVEKPKEMKQKEIKPDDSEVGSLLKMLMESKISETQVTEIMANVRPSKSDKRMPENVHLALRGAGMISRAEKEEMKKQDLRAGRIVPQEEAKMPRRGKAGKLFNGPRTHYFDELFKIGKSQEKTFVSRHELDWQEKLRNAVQKQAPVNRFEEMMLKENKLWPLPVDNEVGLDEEYGSTFEDHVFLDHHLDMFPETGNLRRFMELVITGLQQNPYLSVNQKVDTINWFKDYFDKFTESDLEF